MTTTSRGPSRRTLVKGAAWSVPVVAMAQPAMAVVCSPNDPSCDPPVRPIVGQNSCKHTQGVNRYHIELIFTNDQRCDTQVHITSFVVAPNSGQDVPFVGVDYDFTIPREDSLVWEYDSEVVGNMANGTVNVTYTYTDCTGAVVEESQSINVDSLPPCDFPYPHDADADVKLDEAPESADVATTDSAPVEPAPAPVEPAPAPAAPVEPAPAPAPADDASATSTP